MCPILDFPEIEYYFDAMHITEKNEILEIILESDNNSLETQLNVLLQVSQQEKAFSNFFMFSIGKLCYGVNKYELLAEKVEKFKESPYIRLWMGYLSYRQGNYEIAKGIFNKINQEEDFFLKIEAIIGLGRIEDRKNRRQGAQALFLDALNMLSKPLKEDKSKIFQDSWFRALYGILWTTRIEGNVEESIEKCSKILEDAKEYADRIHIANFHMLLGILYKYLGKFNITHENFETAKRYFRQLGDKRSEAAVIANQSDVERMKGNLDNAIGRLLSVISIYEQLNDMRSIALVHSTLGEIYGQKAVYEEAIKEFRKSQEILSSINSRDILTDYALAELYIELAKWEEFEPLFYKIVEERSEEELAEDPHVMYIIGKKEVRCLNLSNARKFLNQALKIAQQKHKKHLSIKILVNLLEVLVYCQVAQLEERDIIEIRKNTEDIKIYIEETQQEPHFKESVEKIEKLIEKAIIEQIKEEKRKLIFKILNELKQLTNMVQYSTLKKAEVGISTTPEQILVLHRSGIPLQRYIKSETIVDNAELFGGMITAVKDIANEILSKNIGRIMTIDYGHNIKILVEYGENDAGIVLLTECDTFHQRRSIHEAIKELNIIELPKKFYGDIASETEEKINNIIRRWFGSEYFEKAYE